MTTATRTPAERIAAMKARVEQKRRREQEEQDRQARQQSVVNALCNALTTALTPLDGLPLTPNGRLAIEVVPVDRPDLVAVRRKGWDELTDPDDPAYPVRKDETLITFAIRCDHAGREAWAEHDGDRIDVGTALDLATAVAEGRLDA